MARVVNLTLPYSEEIKKQIIKESGNEVYDFINDAIDLYAENTYIFSTINVFNIEYYAQAECNTIINLKRINDIRFINKFFESVNNKLRYGGYFVLCVETKNLRKKRILAKYPVILNWIYYSFDFLFKRVFPKFFLTKRIYFMLTRGHNRVITQVETLGRLYSCGFEFVQEKFINNVHYFIVKKIKEPVFDFEPTYGPLIKLKRVGKNGKIIKVYKMRTMHPYAEYLQDYVYAKNQLKEGGKFNDDFRITTIGKIMRTFWIDELPMLINFFKGDLKLVGVRPLSQQYLSLYNKKVKDKRLNHKPGLIPPFYAHMPKTLDKIMASELKYLTEHEKHPFLTDLRYFCVAIYNILLKRKRSS